MNVAVAENDTKEFTLRAFLRYLAEQELLVARDSCVAAALRLDVTQRVMSSAVHTALTCGYVRRSRSAEARDFYDNPVTFTITERGRKYLTVTEQ